MVALAVLLGVACSSDSTDPPAEDADWDYAELGPVTWPERFAGCDGSAQSPIDVQAVNATNAVGTIGLSIDYADSADVTVFNDTHTVEVEVEAGAGVIRVDRDDVSQTYELVQFHWHTPSEHELSGYREEAELHLVHSADDGSLAVIGVLIEEGAELMPVAGIWEDLPAVDDTRRIEVDGVDLDGLVPTDAAAYNYAGSLTVPPCTEPVDWFVLDEVASMSRAQLQDLRDIFSGEDFPSGNARSPQRLVVDDVELVGIDRS